MADVQNNPTSLTEEIHADDCASQRSSAPCDCGTRAWHDGQADAERRIVERLRDKTVLFGYVDYANRLKLADALERGEHR